MKEFFLDGKIWNGIGRKYYYNIKENSNDIQKELIFECEYLYGLIKKGKIYHKGKLEFDRECYFYQKWNGKGNDEDGNVIYELKNGGKTYYKDCKISFEEEFLNWKINGKGKEYDQRDELIYEGEYLNGQIIEKEKEKNFLK